MFESRRSLTFILLANLMHLVIFNAIYCQNSQRVLKVFNIKWKSFHVCHPTSTKEKSYNLYRFSYQENVQFQVQF